MTEVTADIATATGRSDGRSLFKVGERTRKRHAAERRFRMMGLAAVIFSILALIGSCERAFFMAEQFTFQ